MFEAFEKALIKYNRPFITLKGSVKNRLDKSVEAIDQLLINHKDLDTFEETIIDLINSIERKLRKELIEAFKEDNRYLDFVIESLEKLND